MPPTPPDRPGAGMILAMGKSRSVASAPAGAFRAHGWSSLHPLTAGGQAADQVTLHEEEENQRRHDNEDGHCHDVAPDDCASLTHEEVDADGQGIFARVFHHGHSEQELLPGSV